MVKLSPLQQQLLSLLDLRDPITSEELHSFLTAKQQATPHVTLHGALSGLVDAGLALLTDDGWLRVNPPPAVVKNGATIKTVPAPPPPKKARKRKFEPQGSFLE